MKIHNMSLFLLFDVSVQLEKIKMTDGHLLFWLVFAHCQATENSTGNEI